jgi:hypothetical protein
MTGTLFWASYAALWVITLALAISTVLAYRFMAEAFVRGPRGRREQGPEIGRTINAVSAPDLSGREVRFGPAVSNCPQLVCFLAAGCKPCALLLPELRAFSEAHGQLIETIAFCDGKAERILEMAEQLGSHVRVVPDPQGQWRQAVQVVSVPFAIAATQDAVVRGKGKARDLAALEVELTRFRGHLLSL